MSADSSDFDQTMRHGFASTYHAIAEIVVRKDGQLIGDGEANLARRVRHFEPLIEERLAHFASFLITKAGERTDLIRAGKYELEALCTRVHATLPDVLGEAGQSEPALFPWNVANEIFARLQARLAEMFDLALGDAAGMGAGLTGHASVPSGYTDTVTVFRKLRAKLLEKCSRNEYGVLLDVSHGLNQSDAERSSTVRAVESAVFEAMQNAVASSDLALFVRGQINAEPERLDSRRFSLSPRFDFESSMASGRVICRQGDLAVIQGYPLFVSVPQWSSFERSAWDRLVKAMGLAGVTKLPPVSSAHLRSWWNDLGSRRELLSLDELHRMARDAFPNNTVPRSVFRSVSGPRKTGPKSSAGISREGRRPN